MTIEEVHMIISQHLADIKPLFVEGMIVTFHAMHPKIPNGDILISSDDMDLPSLQKSISSFTERAKKEGSITVIRPKNLSKQRSDG